MCPSNSESAGSRPFRVLLAKTSLDGHWRGVQIIAKTLRDAGFEVIVLGMARDDEIAAAALSEDVDLVGLNVGGKIEVVERILDRLAAEGVEAPVVAGGTIAPGAAERLRRRGVAVFPPGSSLQSIVDASRELAAAHRP